MKCRKCGYDIDPDKELNPEYWDTFFGFDGECLNKFDVCCPKCNHEFILVEVYKYVERYSEESE